MEKVDNRHIILMFGTPLRDTNIGNFLNMSNEITTCYTKKAKIVKFRAFLYQFFNKNPYKIKYEKSIPNSLS